MSSRYGGLRWSCAALGADQVSPAGGLAAFGGLTGRLLPEQLGEDRGLAVVDIAGCGEQRDRAGGPRAPR